MSASPPYATLTVMGGPANGAQLVVDAVDEVLVGSDPECNLFLDLPGVSPIHARIWVDQEGAQVRNTRAPRGTFVNDDAVEDETPLRDGDILWLGPPGDENSVMIQCRVPARPERVASVPLDPDDLPAFAPEAEPDADALFEPAAEPGVGADDLMLADEPAAAAAEPEPAFAEPEPAFAEPAFAEPEPAFAEPEPAFAEPEPALAEPEPAFVAPSAEPEAEPEPPPFMLADEATDDASAASSADDLFMTDTPAAPAAPQDAAAEPAPFELAPAWEDAPAWQPAPEAPAAEAEEAPFEAEPDAAPEPEAVEAPPQAPAPAVAPAPAAAARPAAPRPQPREDGLPVTPAPGREPRAPRAGAVAPATRAAAPAPAARPSAGGSKLPLYGGIAAGVLVVGGIAGFFAMRAMSAPKLASIAPARATIGDSVTLSGDNFDPDAASDAVSFGGVAGRVVQATPTSLKVVVPKIPAAAGKDTPVQVTVSVKGRATGPVALAVFLAPRAEAVTPSVAMPGDIVKVSGNSFGGAPVVTVGGQAAEVVETSDAVIAVKVPALTAAPGTNVPVVVKTGQETSPAVSLMIGKLPLVLGVKPASGAPGDVLTVDGRGFSANPLENDVRLGGVKALVVGATPIALQVLVPRTPAVEKGRLEVKVPGSDAVGSAEVALPGMPDQVGFRFTAEPMEDQPGHDHAVIVSGAGPAFVLSAAGGRGAGARAGEAVARLNEAAQILSATPGTDFESRGLDGADPVVGITYQAAPVLRVTREDAAAYDEDWTGLKGKGGPATPGRLAVWWTAEARDLASLLLRDERPTQTAALAPEGKALQEMFDAARKSKTVVGMPRKVAEAKKDALKLVALRVPATVTPPAGAPAATTVTEPTASAETPAATTPPAAGGALQLVGEWNGRESVDGVPSLMAINFTGKGGGKVTLTRAVDLTMQLTGVEQTKDGVKFRLDRGRTQYYVGKWDGQRIQGTVYADPASRSVIGSFELTPGR